jgi:hypothetical protein
MWHPTSATLPVMPEWTLRGGLVGGGLVYEHRDGARAYVHLNDDGDLDVAAWDPGSGGERTFPNREALDTIIDMDLKRMREGDRDYEKAMLLLSGVGDVASVRSYRGRGKKWTPALLARFAKDVVDQGLPSAAASWGVKQRQGLAIMRAAEREGLVRIEKSGGERSRNVYSMNDEDAGHSSTPQERADWHRRRWFALGPEATKPPTNREK